VRTDCLLIGHNESDFASYVHWVRGMGETSGAHRDLNLALLELDGRPMHALDVLNRLSPLPAAGRPLRHTDFLWPTITYLGTFLHRRGFRVDYVNEFRFEQARLREKLRRDDILAIGITTTLYVSAAPVIEIIAFLREHNRTAKIVVGGPYVANLAAYSDPRTLQEQLQYVGADVYVISSEGETALARVLAALRDGGDLAGVPNIAYRRDGEYVFTPAEIEANPLEENLEDYGLFPAEALRPFVTLRTSKSCPFSCAFCGFPQRAGKYKYLPVELVERQLDQLRALGGVTTLTFIDDTFNVPKPRFRELLRMMIRNRYGFRWNSFYRSDHGDEETVRLMAEAGCEGVFLGAESGSDEMLQRMNKTSRRRNYLEAIPLLRRHGIITHASLIVGFPGETPDSVAESISLVEEAQPDFFRAQLWYCDPITPIWAQREAYGVSGSAFNWSHRTMDHRAAADIVDHMFLTVRNSVWLPQNGFELWSVFYLLRHGCSLDAIKTYLRAFNAAIKERLVGSPGREPGAAALDLLRRAARVEDPVPDALRRDLARAEAGSRRAAPVPAALAIAPPTDEELQLLSD
jgi:radical SAM PhpK family P-methyltransferase